jgi:hypothetical protein
MASPVTPIGKRPSIEATNDRRTSERAKSWRYGRRAIMLQCSKEVFHVELRRGVVSRGTIA